MQDCMWQSVSVIQEVHKVAAVGAENLNKLSGFFLCQRRTFSVGRWMMEREKKNGVEGLESMHTHWHTRTQWPHFERVQNKCRTVSRCAPKPLSVQSRHFLFVTPTLYKHWGMSAFLLKSITNEHARIVNSLQRVVIVLTGNLTHDENAARIGFSCYFHLSVTKDSLFEKKRDSERKE